MAEEPLKKPRVWTVALAFALALALQLASGVVLVVAGALPGAAGAVSSGNQEALQRHMQAFAFSFPALTASVLMSTAILVSLSALGARLSPLPARERLRLLPFGGGVATVAALSVAVWALGMAEGSLTSLLHPEPTWSGAQLGKAIGGMTSGQTVVMGALVGLSTPVAEELFFRGYLQSRLTRRWGRWIGIVIASALFGVFHLDPTHALVAFGLGLVLGWACEATGSVVPSIAMHMVNNLFAVAASSVSSGGDQASRSATVVRMLLAAALSALALVAARRKLVELGPR